MRFFVVIRRRDIKDDAIFLVVGWQTSSIKCGCAAWNHQLPGLCSIREIRQRQVTLNEARQGQHPPHQSGQQSQQTLATAAAAWSRCSRGRAVVRRSCSPCIYLYVKRSRKIAGFYDLFSCHPLLRSLPRILAS